MSVLTVTPTVDTIVELEEGRTYCLVTVAWEYDEARYILPAPCPAPIKIDFAPLIAAMPRDEAFVIMDVKYL